MPTQPMKKPRERQKNSWVSRALFTLLVVGAILVMLYFFVLRPANGNMSILQNGIGSVLSPVQNAFSSATTWVNDLFAGQREKTALQQKVDSLTEENVNLSLQLSLTEETEQENERLKSLLDAQSVYESLSPVYAKVIARDSGLWFDTFSVNRGSLSGIAVNMCVINSDGLIGRIYEVGLNYAKVMSIIDSRSAVACLIERTRDNGVMRGQITDAAESSQCNVYYIPNVTDVIPGDLVISSGVDTLFPKGVPIGKVTEVSRQTDSSDKYVVVQPNVDFQHIEEVLILREMVETDQEGALPAVPTATPRPVVTTDVTPSATPVSAATPLPDNNSVWTYPTAVPEETPESVESASPDGTQQPAEDIWANQ